MKKNTLYIVIAVLLIAGAAVYFLSRKRVGEKVGGMAETAPPIPPPRPAEETNQGQTQPEKIDPGSGDGEAMIVNRMRILFNSSEYPTFLAKADIKDPFPAKMDVLKNRILAATGAGSFKELPYRPASLYPAVVNSIEEAKGTRDKDLRSATDQVRANYFEQLNRIFDVQFLPGWSQTYNEILKPSGYTDADGDPSDDWNRFFMDLDTVLETILKNMKTADDVLRSEAVKDYQEAGYSVLGYA
jgi:hypothetical protein